MSLLLPGGTIRILAASSPYMREKSAPREANLGHTLLDLVGPFEPCRDHLVFRLVPAWRLGVDGRADRGAEIAARVSSLGRFVWSWMRQREPGTAATPRVEVREVVRTVRVKETGDINISSLLNVLVFLGLALAAAAL
jgi:hypothetical protein